MSTQDFAFRRCLSPDFLAALEALIDRPDGQWWRDVMAHPNLFLAIRNNALAAYYRGALIFNCILEGNAVVPETHVKYLIRQRQAQVRLEADGGFKFDPAEFMWIHYQPQTTLKEMMQAANAYAGIEKTGLHALIMASDNVIDVEASFWRSEPDADEINASAAAESSEAIEDFLGESSDASREKASRRLDRIDAVSLEDRDGALWLVFHEAKHFSNKELRGAAGRPPPVVTQIARYRQAIKKYEPDIRSYADVCRALTEIQRMKAGQREGASSLPSSDNSLIARGATGETLHIDPDPRLIIYGFDKAQRDSDLWQEHYSRLKNSFGLTVYAIGDPRQAGPAAFARRAGA